MNEAAGSTNIPTLFGPLGPLARGSQWFTPDASGSIATVTGSSGSAIAQNCYGVFGQVMTTNPNSGDPLQFHAGMSDASTGLDYGIDSGFYEPSLGMGVGGAAGLAGLARVAPGAGAQASLASASSGDWLNHASDLFGCWGDTLTFGLTADVRQLLGVDSQVNRNSGWCHAGTLAGTINAVLIDAPEEAVTS